MECLYEPLKKSHTMHGVMKPRVVSGGRGSLGASLMVLTALPGGFL